MTTGITNKITQLHSFIDEAFDPKKTSSYQLTLQIGISEIHIAVNDRQSNKFIALEKYSLQQVYNFDGVAEQLDSVLKESKITDHRFRSVSCIIVNNISTLVPDQLYESDRKKMYLKFNAALEGDEFISVDEIKSLEAKNVFALPFSIKAKLDGQYLNVTYHHISSTLIDVLVPENKNQSGKKLIVHVQQDQFQVLLLDGKNFLFYNTFSYHSPEDFIYYLLFVCEQLQLNPEKIDTVLLGEIEKTSAIYTTAHKYVRHLKFGERTGSFDYSYQLQTLPKHFYFTLFNNYIS
jgi:uncharacterized protein DUF3822